jgi:hypothetical protein
MATDTPKKPGTQQRSIDEMRASARMRARLMRKTPKPVEFPRRSVDVTNAGPPGHLFALAGTTSAAMGVGTDADGPEEPSAPKAAK